MAFDEPQLIWHHCTWQGRNAGLNEPNPSLISELLCWLEQILDAVETISYVQGDIGGLDICKQSRFLL
jgi:hypothetical protein